MEKLILKVGNDNGNSEQDMIINGEQICQPNVYSKVNLSKLLLDEVNPEYVIKHIHENLLVTIDSPAVNPGTYYVGQKALDSGLRVHNIEVGMENSKTDNELIRINTLAHIAGYAAQKAYLKNANYENDISVKVDMATALPIKQYNRENANRMADYFTVGKHKCTVLIGTKRANVEVIFNFVKVIPEGVTAAWALKNKDIVSTLTEELQEDNASKVIQAVNSDKKILHIAIGEGTTEYPVTTGIVFDPNFIKGSNNGIGIAIDESLDEFKEQTGLASYSRQKYSEVLREKNHKYNAIAEDIIEDPMEEQSEQILKYAKAEIQKANNEVELIAVYGGGSIPMRKFLEQKLINYCSKSLINLLYVPAKYAVTLESKGLYEFVNSTVFKTLKEKCSK